jgi:transportin-3
MEQVIAALQVLYGSPDADARREANASLQNFQKTPEAWSTASLILSAPDAPVEAKMFAGQTFKSKITYDLGDLALADRMALRDSLLSVLRASTGAAKAVTRQIAVALADLLLQLPEWQGAIAEMIEGFGREPATASSLLEFLSVLAEESANNGRIDPTVRLLLLCQ